MIRSMLVETAPESQCPEGARPGLLRSSAASLEKQALVNKHQAR